MRKIVNGKVIDIDNIDLFELAEIGNIKCKVTASETSNAISGSINTEKLGRIITLYNAFYRAMAYPLYAVETDIKYATLANFIKHAMKLEDPMFIEDGLYIVLNIQKMVAVHMLGSYWALKEIDHINRDNTDIMEYCDSLGFEEYTWLLNKVKNKDRNANYYEEFMPKFVRACNNDAMIMKWELENILTFGNIPQKIEIADNTIAEYGSQTVYTMDIYTNGTVNSGRIVKCWDIDGTTAKQSVRQETVARYEFDIYRKDYSDRSKLKKVNIPGMNGVFATMYEVKVSQQLVDFPKFRAIIIGKFIVYEVAHGIYVCGRDQAANGMMIAGSSEIYSAKENAVYISRRKVVQDIKKISIFGYSLVDGKNRIYKEIYSR